MESEIRYQFVDIIVEDGEEGDNDGAGIRYLKDCVNDLVFLEFLKEHEIDATENTNLSKIRAVFL